MNRKITLVIIAAITALLPAVAVADVLVTGHISLESNLYHHPAFEFSPGPNYLAANESNDIGWTSQQGQSMGLLDLQGNCFNTIVSVNAINLTFSESNPSVPASFMGFYMNISSSTFPAGTEMVISTYMLNVTSVQASAISHYSDGNPALGLNASQHTALAVDISENPHVLITSFAPLQTLFISYILPPNWYQGSTASLTCQFVAFA